MNMRNNLLKIIRRSISRIIVSILFVYYLISSGYINYQLLIIGVLLANVVVIVIEIITLKQTNQSKPDLLTKFISSPIVNYSQPMKWLKANFNPLFPTEKIKIAGLDGTLQQQTITSTTQINGEKIVKVFTYFTLELPQTTFPKKLLVCSKNSVIQGMIKISILPKIELESSEFNKKFNLFGEERNIYTVLNPALMQVLNTSTFQDIYLYLEPGILALTVCDNGNPEITQKIITFATQIIDAIS